MGLIRSRVRRIGWGFRKVISSGHQDQEGSPTGVHRDQELSPTAVGVGGTSLSRYGAPQDREVSPTGVHRDQEVSPTGTR